MDAEKLVISYLLTSETYCSKVYPFIKLEYFKENETKIITSIVLDHIKKYDKRPNKEELEFEISSKLAEYNGDMLSKTLDCLNSISFKIQDDDKIQWALDKTEKFVKDRAFFNALELSLKVVDGEKSKVELGDLPKIMEDALAITFDNNLGHQYILDADKRYEIYANPDAYFKFPLDVLNKAINGGLPEQSLTIFLGGTGTGKSLMLCSLASSWVKAGKKVVYFTFEMSEILVAQRIDTNLFSRNISEVKRFDKDQYLGDIKRMSETYGGEVIIKEYPTRGANILHLKAFLKDLKMKKGFVPDVIIVDYLTIMAPAKKAREMSLYENGKSVTEELRSVSQELKTPVVTAMQTNRSGQNHSSLDFENIGESHAISQTADNIIGISRSEDLDEKKQISLNVIKARNGKIIDRFLLGVDISKQKIYELDTEKESDLNSPAFSSDLSVNVEGVF